MVHANRLVIAAVCVAFVAPLALAEPALARGIKYQSTRSNTSKRPGIAAPVPGVEVTIAPFVADGISESETESSTEGQDRLRRVTGATNRNGNVRFAAVAPGEYLVTVSPIRQGEFTLDGLTIRGGLVLCDAETQTSAEVLTCSILVEGTRPVPVMLGLLAIDPSEASEAPERSEPPRRLPRERQTPGAR